jgi:hypothetical protein
VVTIVETSWATDAAGGSSNALDDTASRGLVLQLPAPPTG